jgi:hypothetical protein
MSAYIHRAWTAVAALAAVAACAPAAVHRSVPAPANALSCAQESLGRMGFAPGDVSSGGDSFKALRVADRYSTYRLEHVVRVQSRPAGALELKAERIERKDLEMRYVPGLVLDEPMGWSRRLDADPVLKQEVERVIQECGASGQGGRGLAR